MSITYHLFKTVMQVCGAEESSYSSYVKGYFTYLYDFRNLGVEIYSMGEDSKKLLDSVQREMGICEYHELDKLLEFILRLSGEYSNKKYKALFKQIKKEFKRNLH